MEAHSFARAAKDGGRGCLCDQAVLAEAPRAAAVRTGQHGGRAQFHMLAEMAVFVVLAFLVFILRTVSGGDGTL